MTHEQGTGAFTLQAFLKWQGWATTGGQAKMAIQSGAVQVNGAIETRRGRKLVVGDEVAMGGQTCVVSAPPDPTEPPPAAD